MNRFTVTCVLAFVGCGGGATTPLDAATDASFVCPRTCDDGLFCNGSERCDPSDPAADADGCVAGAAPCPVGCDEGVDACVDDCVDADGDGRFAIECGGDDCDDSDDSRYPGAIELCDDVDQDCDPSTVGPDMDGDGDAPRACCNGEVCGRDCNDFSMEVNPDAEEICDGRDNDCDDVTDEGVTLTFYRDVDGDNYGDPDDSREACDRPDGHVFNAGDCDDRNEHAHVDTDPERCDGFDNDCDGEVDEGLLVRCFVDLDRDGYAPAGAVGAVECGVCPLGSTDRDPAIQFDCDDTDVLANPGRVEVCDGLGRDDDCDGAADPAALCECATGTSQNCAAYGLRGVCAAGTMTCASGRWGACTVEPADVELCGGGDGNCNGIEDDEEAADRQLLYLDEDGDGYGVGSPVRRCPGEGYASSGGDCDDTRATSFPGADEVCNARDDDCDGSTDEGVTTRYYHDRDGDGVGDQSTFVDTCSARSGFVSVFGDLEDTNPCATTDLEQPGSTPYEFFLCTEQRTTLVGDEPGRCPLGFEATECTIPLSPIKPLIPTTCRPQLTPWSAADRAGSCVATIFCGNDFGDRARMACPITELTCRARPNYMGPCE